MKKGMVMWHGGWDAQDVASGGIVFQVWSAGYGESGEGGKEPGFLCFDYRVEGGYRDHRELKGGI